MPEKFKLIDELAGNARMGGLLKSCGMELLHPRPAIWPIIPDTFAADAALISNALPDRWQQLFRLFCLASHLRSSRETPPQVLDWLAGVFDDSNGFFPVSWNRFDSWRWGVLPLPLVDRRGKGTLRYALTAVSEVTSNPQFFIPENLKSSPDPSVHDAIGTVQYLARMTHPDHSFIFLPLLNPDCAPCEIEQGSFALPLLLAFYSLCMGSQLPPILATGCLNRDGELRRVVGIEEKIRLAGISGCGAFMHPTDHRGGHFSESPEDGVLRFGVADLRTAYAIWESYHPEAGLFLTKIADDLGDPARLVERLPDIPETLIPLPVVLRSLIGETIGSFIVTEPDVAGLSFAIFAKKLESLPAPSDSSRSLASELLSLVTTGMLEQLRNTGTGSSVAFRIAQLQVDSANHAGLVSKGAVWSSFAQRIREDTRVTNERYEQDAVFSEVRDFIRTRHNRYCFSPLDANKLDLLVRDHILGLQEIFRHRRKRDPDRTDRTLGAFYGLKAQHSAFCLMTDEALSYSDQALDAFGYNGKVQLEADCRQQLIYRAYILIDAGRMDEAAGIIARLVGADTSSLGFGLHCHNDPYLHALYARYLAESGEEDRIYYRQALSRLPVVRHFHPWQLWCRNVAISAPSVTEKSAFLKASLDICRVPERPTIQVMALLPLSVMKQEEIMSAAFLEAAVREVRDIIASGEVDSGHFSGIINFCWNEVLDYVAENERKLFPFNYR